MSSISSSTKLQGHSRGHNLDQQRDMMIGSQSTASQFDQEYLKSEALLAKLQKERFKQAHRGNFPRQLPTGSLESMNSQASQELHILIQDDTHTQQPIRNTEQSSARSFLHYQSNNPNFTSHPDPYQNNEDASLQLRSLQSKTRDDPHKRREAMTHMMPPSHQKVISQSSMLVVQGDIPSTMVGSTPLNELNNLNEDLMEEPDIIIGHQQKAVLKVANLRIKPTHNLSIQQQTPSNHTPVIKHFKRSKSTSNNLSLAQTKSIPVVKREKSVPSIKSQDQLTNKQLLKAYGLAAKPIPSEHYQTIDPDTNLHHQQQQQLRIEMQILDQHYKLMMKFEREDFTREISRVKLETSAKLERKYKKHIAEMLSKLEDQAKCHEMVQRYKLNKEKSEKQSERANKRVAVLEAQAQVDQELIGKLQRKLDDMWERQGLERENARLMSKYETEHEVKGRLQAMSDRLVGYESELKHLNQVRDVLIKQVNELKNRISNQSITMRAERKVMETESKLLNEQNRELATQLRDILDENCKLKSQLQDLRDQRDLYERHEKLKASLSPNKQQREGTARFTCNMCDQWTSKLKALSERYFESLTTIKGQVEEIKNESRKKILETSQDIQKQMLTSLSSCLESIRQRVTNATSGQLQTADPQEYKYFDYDARAHLPQNYLTTLKTQASEAQLLTKNNQQIDSSNNSFSNLHNHESNQSFSLRLRQSNQHLRGMSQPLSTINSNPYNTLNNHPHHATEDSLISITPETIQNAQLNKVQSRKCIVKQKSLKKIDKENKAVVKKVAPVKGSLYKRLEGEIKDLNKKIALIVK